MNRSCGQAGLMLVFCLTLLRTSGSAQDATGKIEGIAKDPQGAVVPNARVTVTHLGTGAERSGKSGSGGTFSFVLLPIGQYRLTVEANNFAKYVREPITLNVNDTLRLAVDLKLGTSQEIIQVSDDAPLVETLGKVTSGREILDLPLSVFAGCGAQPAVDQRG